MTANSGHCLVLPGRRNCTPGSQEGTAVEFVKTRIGRVLLANEIPTPRDVIIIALINTCDVFRFILPIDDEAEERIQLVSQMDLIGRSLAAAVSHNLAGPLLRRSALSKKIPTVSLRKLLLNPHDRSGNIPALFADLTQEYGPVFQICPPFQKPMNLPCRSADKPMGASERAHVPEGQGLLRRLREGLWREWSTAFLDGADHFRFRKSMVGGVFSRQAGRPVETSSTTMPGISWRTGKLERSMPRRPCPGE